MLSWELRLLTVPKKKGPALLGDGPLAHPSSLKNELQTKLNDPGFSLRIKHPRGFLELRPVNPSLGTGELGSVECIEEFGPELEPRFLAKRQPNVLEYGQVKHVMRPATEDGRTTVAEGEIGRPGKSRGVKELGDGLGS